MPNLHSQAFQNAIDRTVPMGVAFHSLRAVTVEEMAAVLADTGPTGPVHIVNA